MDFYIVTSDSKLFDYDKEQLDAITQENIARHGLLVDTDIEDFKEDMITLLTTIDIARVASGTIDIAEPKRLLTFKSKTMFKIEDTTLVSLGVTDRGVSVFESMITIAQAHAYGAFNVTVKQMNLIRLPMEVSPIEKYLEGITDFLSSQIQ
jgi:hypothetical protein